MTTNSAEAYLGPLKRDINGVYHHVSREHLHRYHDGLRFRDNPRDVSAMEWAKRLLGGVSSP